MKQSEKKNTEAKTKRKEKYRSEKKNTEAKRSEKNIWEAKKFRRNFRLNMFRFEAKPAHPSSIGLEQFMTASPPKKTQRAGPTN
jgi:hypothetical protein